MGAITDIKNGWREKLSPASFRKVIFHVETSARASGRRVVVHEYPKRNQPYAEDMGRSAIRWTFTGYILLHDKGGSPPRSPPGSNPPPRASVDLVQRRNALIEALEADGGGDLIHPSISMSYDGPMKVMCERYAVTESRQKGGYYEFDMTFVELGEIPKPVISNSRDQLVDAAGNAVQAGSIAISNGTVYLQTGRGGDQGFVQGAPNPNVQVQ